MPPAPASEIFSDESGQKLELENLSPTETGAIETVADAWKSIFRDVSNTRTDLDETATANDVNDFSSVADINDQTTSPGTGSGGGAETGGDSEVVISNNNNGSGGKTALVLKPSPSVGMSLQSFLEVPNIGGSGKNGGAENGSSTSLMDEAWKQLSMSYVYFKEQRVGTLAAIDTGSETLNYNQVDV